MYLYRLGTCIRRFSILYIDNSTIYILSHISNYVNGLDPRYCVLTEASLVLLPSVPPWDFIGEESALVIRCDISLVDLKNSLIQRQHSAST